MSVFVHAQGIKTVHAWGGGGGGGVVQKLQNSVHVVVECPLRQMNPIRRTGGGSKNLDGASSNRKSF